MAESCEVSAFIYKRYSIFSNNPYFLLSLFPPAESLPQANHGECDEAAVGEEVQLDFVFLFRRSRVNGLAETGHCPISILHVFQRFVTQVRASTCCAPSNH